jgi:hypothetical protein
LRSKQVAERAGLTVEAIRYHGRAGRFGVRRTILGHFWFQAEQIEEVLKAKTNGSHPV